MTITVNTPDGGTAQFPDGTSPDVMTSALRSKFGGPGGATAATAQIDASSKMSGIGRTLENAFTLGGADWLYSKVPGMPDLATQKAQTETARESVPAVVRVPAEIGAYAMGPGKLLGPGGMVAEGAGIGGVAAEGALAGGLSSGFGSNFDPTATATGAGVGTALGGAAGGLTKGANAGLQKAFGSSGSVDPAAAIARTKAAEDNIYTQMRQVPIHPDHVDQTIGGVMSNLDPSVETGMSGGLKSQIRDIRQTLQEQGTLGNSVNADQVNSWKRQIDQTASRERYPTDGIVAKQISDGLDGVLQANGAGDLNAKAAVTSQQRIMAENLAEWQRKAAATGAVGQAPVTEAENWFQGDPEKYQALIDAFQKGQHPPFLSSALGHIAANATGAVGGAIAGFPGLAIGEALGYIYAKPAIYKAMKGYNTRQLQKAYQQLYPQFTGVQPTGAVQAPTSIPFGNTRIPVGDLIKSAMLGSAY